MDDRESPLESDEDVEAILQIAVRRTGLKGRDLRDQLIETAHELGISDERLAEAESIYQSRKQAEVARSHAEAEEQELWQLFRKTQVSDFLSHFGSYVAVCLFLVAIDWTANKHITWSIWPLLGWGLAVVLHLFALLTGVTSEQQEEFERFKAKRRRKNSSDP